MLYSIGFGGNVYIHHFPFVLIRLNLAVWDNRLGREVGRCVAERNFYLN